MDDDESTTLARRADPGTLARGFVPHTWDAMKEMALKLSKAQGFVPKEMLGEPHQIMAAIMTGLEIGVPPMQALRSVHVIDGRPTLSAELMLSIAISHGIRHQWLQTDAKIAHLKLTREGFDPHEHRFTIEEAKDANLLGKNNWRKYPAQMLRARCLSGALTAFCPDVLGAGVYVEGEIEEDEPPRREPAPPPVDVVEGEPVDVEPEAEPRDLSAEVELVAQELLRAESTEDITEARKMSGPIWPHLTDGQKERLTALGAEAKVRVSQARQAAEDAALEGLGEGGEDPPAKYADAAAMGGTDQDDHMAGGADFGR